MKTVKNILRILAVIGALAMVSAGDDCDVGDKGLSDNWKFKPVEKFSPEYRSPDYDDWGWGDAPVPGQWQRIPGLEKYHGRGVYRLVQTFEGDTTDKRYHLLFNGVFYKARVFLNGAELGEHQGYFQPFEFEITDLLEKENVLVVEVECLREKQVTRKKQVLGVFGNWDVISSYYNPGGIWAPVTVRKTGRAWINSFRLSTLEVKPEVRVRIQAGFKGEVPEDARLELLFEPDNFEGDSIAVSFPLKGKDNIDLEVALPRARVWNPHKRGFPHCYSVVARLAAKDRELDLRYFLTGFRTVRVEDDYHFFVNGEPLYIKGNNYAPSLVYLSETTRDLVDTDVEMMKKANYDMVRVHAHVDHPEFYRACDRGGMLVWQDGPFQWGYHPDILETAVGQTRDMVRLLYNHPSIAVWNCHNEPLAAGLDRTRPNPLDLARSVRPVLSMQGSGAYSDWNYDVLDAALERAVKEEDPYRPVNRASGRVGGAAHDWHNYYGWYVGEVDDFPGWLEKEYRRDPAMLRFTTEFGAQAFPVYESAIKFMDPDIGKLGPRQRRRLHLENSWQPGIMYPRVKRRHYPDLESYILATQEYQARLLKFHVERVRMTKYDPNYGCIAFLHNDSHPAITWSVVDVWREPKLGYFALRDCFRDPYVMMPFRFAPYRKGETVTFPVHVVNDTLKEWRGCRVRALLPDGSELEFGADLLPDMKPVVVGSFEWTFADKGEAVIELTLSGGGFEPVVNRYRLEVE